MASVNLGTGVLPGSDAQITEGVAGVAILAGQQVYKDAANNNVLKLAAATSQAAAADIGTALTSAPTPGQPVKVQFGGRLTGTATLVVGTNYYVSATPGSVCPEADLLTGQYPTYVGQADTATSIKLNIFAPGVAKP